MSNRSNSSARGIRYAIAIGFSLLALFYLGETISHFKRPGYYRAPRTTTLSVRAQPGKAIRIVSEPLPVVSDVSLEQLDRSVWLTYKSEAPSRLDRIEPPAGARLSAPISIDASDPFLEGATAAGLRVEGPQIQESIEASTVSSAKPVSVRISSGGSVADPWGRNWPRATQLENELIHLQGLASGDGKVEIREWLTVVQQVFSDLQTHPLGSDTGEPLLSSLEGFVSRGYELSKQFATDTEIARELARLAYSLERRRAVWTSVQQCVKKSKEYIPPRDYVIDADRIGDALEVARNSLSATDDQEGWNRYLMLDRVEDLAKGRIGSKDEQVHIARQFLTRVTATRVSSVQLKVLRSAPVHRLADQVHPLTISPVDYRKLIMDIEMVECNPVHRSSISLADSIMSLRFSEHPELGAVASAINNHYRNANIRISASEAFLNRMMPKDQIANRPVQQRILGADTRGASQVQTRLKVDLVPESHAWRVRLHLDGDINSTTRSSRNGATFFNSSDADVQAQRELRIDGQSLTINGSPARVESSDSLRRFSTDWDSMPIVGDMFRYVAHREFTQSRPIANRITQRLIAKQTDEEFDTQLKSKIDTAQDGLESRLLGPLQTLQLSPLVMDMQSTEDRLIARYRVANENQLSAFTPRPVAPGDSLLSIQAHQSIFNNLVDRAIDAEREWTIQQLSDSIADLLQQPRPELASDTPNDVTIKFAYPNPISVEFEDDRMLLTLRIASLEQPGRIHLKNFIIRSSYTANVQGLQAELVRDGVVSIDGHRLGSRDRLPLRAIFTKVFAAKSNIPMVAQQLLDDPRAKGFVVSQFEMRDGWLAIAVTDRSMQEVASPSKTPKSIR
jgi:hypothetical protein